MASDNPELITSENELEAELLTSATSDQGSASVNNVTFKGSQTGIEHLLRTINWDIYESEIAVTPLYDGPTVTVLQALVEHFQWFTLHPHIRKEALSDVLYMQHHTILPQGNLLLDFYPAAMKLIELFFSETHSVSCLSQ